MTSELFKVTTSPVGLDGSGNVHRIEWRSEPKRVPLGTGTVSDEIRAQGLRLLGEAGPPVGRRVPGPPDPPGVEPGEGRTVLDGDKVFVRVGGREWPLAELLR